MSGRRAHRVAAIALLLGGMFAASGCAVAVNCPAIAYLRSVTLDTTAYPGVTDVQFCIEGECTPSPGESADSGSLLEASVVDDVWTLGLDMRAPDEILIRLFDDQGALIRESEEPISWTFTEGPCPGPATSETVVLR